jgi:hypothetical protein
LAVKKNFINEMKKLKNPKVDNNQCNIASEFIGYKKIIKKHQETLIFFEKMASEKKWKEFGVCII